MTFKKMQQVKEIITQLLGCLLDNNYFKNY